MRHGEKSVQRGPRKMLSRVGKILAASHSTNILEKPVGAAMREVGNTGRMPKTLLRGATS